MKKLVNLLFLAMIGTFISYPCQCMKNEKDFADLPNELILSICKSENIHRNTLALVNQKWRMKAIDLTTCLSSPKNNSQVLLSSIIEECPIRIPQRFILSGKINRLNLTNGTPLNEYTISGIINLKLKVFTAIYCNQLTDGMINNLTTLETLKLISNLKLTDEALIPLVSLKRLKLCQQDKIMGTFLQYLTNLTRLHLHGTYAIIVSSLSGLSKLKILSLKEKYTLVDEDEELTKASSFDEKGSYSKDLIHLNKFGLHTQPNITLLSLTTLPSLEHLTLQGDLVISQAAMNQFEGKLGDKKFIKKGFCDIYLG